MSLNRKTQCFSVTIMLMEIYEKITEFPKVLGIHLYLYLHIYISNT